MFALRVDDLSGDAVRALLAFHLSGIHASSPARHVHVLNLAATVWGQAHAELGLPRAQAI